MKRPVQDSIRESSRARPNTADELDAARRLVTRRFPDENDRLPIEQALGLAAYVSNQSGVRQATTRDKGKSIVREPA